MKPAKSVIEIWLWGGPCQLETFDPKPAAGVDYNNGLKAIPTAAKGMEIHEWLPKLAECADLFSVIRSMTHPHFGHETATYLMQTGRNPGGGTTYPAIGAMISMMKAKEYGGDLPPFVILTQGKGRFSEVGFLGEKWAPLVTGGNPVGQDFVVDGIVPPGGLTQKQISERFDVLESLEAPSGQDDFAAAGAAARKVMSGNAAKTFALSLEPESVRRRYGRTRIGQSCLAARRLVEYGVPYITINVPGWDSHKRHFETMKRATADMDQAVSALLEDLKAKNLLDGTVVWVSGEFGRTPRIQREATWNGGRNHWCKCFSALIAGGGFRGGCVVGRSNDTTDAVAERPVSPVDFLGSICEVCGIDPDGPLPNPRGLKLNVMPEAPASGRLREIYA